MRPLIRTEPAPTSTTPHGLADKKLTTPAARQIHAAYDELAQHYVDALTAREWLADLVASIGEDRARQEVAPFRDIGPATAQPDTTIPTRTEHAHIHRMLTVALAVLNGRRARLRDLNDRHITTGTGRVGINAAAKQVAHARLNTLVTIRTTEPEATEPLKNPIQEDAMLTYTQRQLEIDALSTRRSTPTDREAISDAVDIYLGRLEQDQGHTIDRNEIPEKTAFAILEIVVNDTQDHTP